MKYLFILAFLLPQIFVFSQHKIKGQIIESKGEALVGATVVLLDADSTMVTFGLTNNKGIFLLEDLSPGEYILQATYISYSNYSQSLSLEEAEKSLELPPIILQESSEILQEITIQAEHIPMGLRGDTLSYNAAAFKTRPNATVEDLLKKLPGIEVDRNGDIKAQGEDVESVLVDGKEFFGKDPKMATKNLEAEAIDKVEVYDKQSDIAEFTGVDDGNEEKTINLKLKEDHKKGGFGNANLSAGTEKTYDSKFNYFRFTPTLQASVIFAANNINKETFTINDRIDFMGGMMNAMAGGLLNLSGINGLQDGVNSSMSLGSNLNYDFSPKLQLLSHYVLNQTSNELLKNSAVQSFTDQFNYSNDDELNSNYRNQNHQINSKLTYKSNPLLEFIFRNNMNWSNESTERSIYSQYFKNNNPQGYSSSNFLSEEKDWMYESDLLLKKKFAKAGRNFISDITFEKGRKLSQDNIRNINRISENVLDIYQDQDFDSDLSQFSLTSDYTEPLSKRLYLTAKYRYGLSKEEPNRAYYDISDSAIFLNEELSADYQKSYQYNIAGIAIKRNAAKLKMDFGLLGQITSLKGLINSGEQSIQGDFSHLLPSFRIEYDLKGNSSISSSLQTRVVAPELEQLLPLPNNSNANYAFIGNPNLIPSYEQNFNLGYNYFDNFNFTNLWLSVRLNQTKDRIVTRSNIDANLFRTIQPINVENYFSSMLHVNFSRPFKPLKINYRIRTRVSLAMYDSFINDIQSDVTDNSYNLRFSINNRKTEFLDIETGIVLDFFTKKYGINPDFNVNYSNSEYFVNAEFYLSKAWVIGSDFNYLFYSNETFSMNTSYALWSARISKYFMDNKLEVKISAFDLLNQNIGFRRSGSINSLREDNFNNLSRYFMLGVHYKIGSGKKGGLQVDFD